MQHNIFGQLIKDGFGLVTLGRNLGLYYAPRENISCTPRGWLFIAVEDKCTAEDLKRLTMEYMEVVNAQSAP